ncbi:hypothetical protein FRC04_005602 [Tulasnella sp. 424]|nr:hypothetical protein FRC04_005602 [Tulasnella sp. 424]
MRLQRETIRARKQIQERQADLLELEEALGPVRLREFQDWDKDHPEIEKFCSNYSDLKQASLRIPLAQEEIVHLRNALGVKAFLIRDGRQMGKSGDSGVAVLTRKQGRVKQAQVRVDQIADRYRRHYSALKDLDTQFGIGTEAGDLKELSAKDLDIITTWTEQDIQYKRGEKRPTVGKSFVAVPWIWKGFGPGLVSKDDSEDVVDEKIKKFNHQAMRVEWLISKALLQRWIEEEKLLREESRRIVAYFCWKEKELKYCHDTTESGTGYRSWLEQKRRMWRDMAKRADETRAKTEEMIAAGRW